jgi:hypothetical protein
VPGRHAVPLHRQPQQADQRPRRAARRCGGWEKAGFCARPELDGVLAVKAGRRR